MTFSFPLCGFPLTFRADGFRILYSAIALFMWGMSALFSPRYFKGHGHTGRYACFTAVTFLATVGVFLSDDLFCTFIFFEIMSLSSYPWVVQEETREALRAGQTYLAVAILGGMVTLMGMFLMYRMAGTLSFGGLRAFAAGTADPAALYLPGVLIFFGFAAKAGVFPLHIWLPKAHPVAPAPASALLSGILTKGGVFGILVVSCNLFAGDPGWGNFLLLLAMITMVLGAAMAIFSVDLKRTLACSSMSQIGFILTGVAMTVLLGEENGTAIRGTVLHMVNHSLLKLDLFLCAGAVYMNTHSLDLNTVRGFGRGKPFLHFCFAMGYLGIIGMPLFNGFLSKSLLHEAILEQYAESGAWAYKAAEILFLFSGGLTAAYMTKLYICIFHQKNKDAKLQQKYNGMKHYLSPASAAALGASAFVLPVLGMLPDLTAGPLADKAAPFLGGISSSPVIHWFSGENIKGALISLAIGAAGYFLIRRFLMKEDRYINRWPVWLDLEDRVYRPLAERILPAAGLLIGRAADRLIDNPFCMKIFPAIITALTRGLEHTVENSFCTKAVPACVTGITRTLDKGTDTAAVALRHTLFRREKKADHTLSAGDRIRLRAGSAMNRSDAAMDALFHEKEYKGRRKDHVARLFALKDETYKANRYISRSVSYGLLLVAFGLCAALVWLIFMQ
ncbi:MAG: proton-conducting transporter membrane subunit [Clostridia bacterium]|nr:proton-conducting transporter membrane subunit [Clostridia bacterium]